VQHLSTEGWNLVFEKKIRTYGARSGSEPERLRPDQGVKVTDFKMPQAKGGDGFALGVFRQNPEIQFIELREGRVESLVQMPIPMNATDGYITAKILPYPKDHPVPRVSLDVSVDDVIYQSALVNIT
jgi:hypothetical protein